MYTLNDISIKTVFDLSGSVQMIKLQWQQASGAAPSTSVDVIVTALKDPFNNIIYSNSDWNNPDLTGQIPPFATEEDLVAVPLDINNKPIEGEYTLQYSVRFYNEIVAVTSGANGTFTIASPSPTFLNGLSDITVLNSSGNDGNYSVSSADSITGVITISGTIPSGVSDGDILLGGEVQGTIDSNTIRTLEVSDLDVQLEMPYNCVSETIQLIDKTKYPNSYTIAQKTQTLYYPAVLNKNPIISTTLAKNVAQTIVNDLWTTTWSGSLVMVVEFYLEGESERTIIRQSFSNSIEQDVVCDYNLCKLICCLEKFRKEFNTYKGMNPSVVYKKAPIMAELAYLMQMASIATTCNKQDIFADVQQNLKEVLNTVDDCNCTGCNDQTTEPQKVVGLSNQASLLEVEQEGTGAITTNVSKIIVNDGITQTDNGNGSVTLAVTPREYKYPPNGTATIPAPELAGKTLNDCIIHNQGGFTQRPAIAPNGDMTFTYVPTVETYVLLFNR